MSVTVTPHLNFHGQARAALEFYQSVFGGELTAATHADFGMPAEVPGASNIVFGQVTSEDGFRIMAYDVPGAESAVASEDITRRENGVTITSEPFFVSLRSASADDALVVWSKLTEGASIIEAFAPSQWSAGFGM